MLYFHGWRVILYCLAISTHLSIIVAQSCYYPDGTVAETFTPCNTTSTASTCCQNGDACLTDGLCYMQWDHSINSGACTDKSWRDPNCFQECPKNSAYRQKVTNTLYRCSDNNWCCSAGGNTTSCCNDLNILLFVVGQASIYNGSAWAPGYTLVPIAALQTNTPAKSASISSNGCPAPTGLTSLNNSTCAGQDDRSTKVGVGVGVGVGVPLLLALLGVSFLLFREKKRVSDRHSGEYPNQTRLLNGRDNKTPLQEMPSEEGAKEMPTTGFGAGAHHELYEDRRDY